MVISKKARAVLPPGIVTVPVVEAKSPASVGLVAPGVMVQVTSVLPEKAISPAPKSTWKVRMVFESPSAYGPATAGPSVSVRSLLRVMTSAVALCSLGVLLRAMTPAAM